MASPTKLGIFAFFLVALAANAQVQAAPVDTQLADEQEDVQERNTRSLGYYDDDGEDDDYEEDEPVVSGTSAPVRISINTHPVRSYGTTARPVAPSAVYTPSRYWRPTPRYIQSPRSYTTPRPAVPSFVPSIVTPRRYWRPVPPKRRYRYHPRGSARFIRIKDPSKYWNRNIVGTAIPSRFPFENEVDAEE